MGCGSSKTMVVQPMRSNELENDEDETGSKLGGRGDSAVSKGTTDSGVVMENGEVPMLPGAVPRKLPPLTAASPGLLQQESPAQRAQSSEILEQLLSQGIIPAGQPTESSSGAGEAYNISLEASEVSPRRPPARLESLKARKEQSPTSRETIDEKMRLAEERCKLSEDELKTGLRTKSARVRAPASTSAAPEEPDTFTPVEQLQNPLTSDQPGTRVEPLYPLLHTQVREAGLGVAEGGEWAREAGGDGREGGGGTKETRKDHGREREGGGSGLDRRDVWEEDEGESRGDEGEGREGGKRVTGDGGGGVQGEEVIRVEELESDSTFQQTDHDEEMF